MSRGTYPRRGAKTGLVADREVWRAHNGHVTPSFGIRRPVELESADAIIDVVFGLQKHGVVPDEPRGMVRDFLTVTLASQHAVERSISHGGGASDLGRARAQLERRRELKGRDDVITVTRGRIRAYGRQLVCASIKSPELLAEIIAMEDVLAVTGLRAARRRGVPRVPHLTLVDAGRGHKFSNDELFGNDVTDDELDAEPETLLAEIDDTFDDVMLFGEEDRRSMIEELEATVPREFQLDGWETYPYDILNPAAVPGRAER